MRTRLNRYCKLPLLGLVLAAGGAAASAHAMDPAINEFVFNHTGSDAYEYIEVLGDPDTSLSSFTVLVVEGDGGGAGIIDDVFPLSRTDAAGRITLGFFRNALENGTQTILLVEGFSGSGGDDLDSDNDGTPDLMPWDRLVDAVAVSDGGGSDRTYAPVTLTPGFDGGIFTVGGASRILNAEDTGTAGDWRRNDFGLLGVPGFAGALGPSEAANTPDAPNTQTAPPAVPPLALEVPQIQGAGHVSPVRFQEVRTSGVVTALPFGKGFYLQDPVGDGAYETSDAVFVSGNDAGLEVGDLVTVTGIVNERIPGGPATGNLSITEILSSAVVSHGASALPAPAIIGRGGRVPPNRVVIGAHEIDPPINLQFPADDAANIFNPETDGIDYYESLESMRVSIERPVTVSPIRVFTPFSSELFALANDGRDVAPRNARTRRGGINLVSGPQNTGDQNPERVQIQFDGGNVFPGEVPALPLGTKLRDVTGVLGYSFGNFEVVASEPIEVRRASRVAPEVSRIVGKRNKLTVASYNVLNLSPLPVDDFQRNLVAAQIVDNLNSPDIVGLQEIQDNSGVANDGVVEADETLEALIDAIALAGGPDYLFAQVSPADGSGGGIPGGNIRNAYLYNPARVQLLELESLTPEVLDAAGALNPEAFEGTRNPLLGRFAFRGEEIVILNNHWTSRFGSTPVFGGPQPFVQAGEEAREEQAQALNDFVDSLLAVEPEARIVVMGDLNTFEFTNDLAEILPGLAGRGGPVGSRERDDDDDKDEDKDWDRDWDRDDEEDARILTNLVDGLRDDKVYTFNFQGNSQALDHMFVTDNLLDGAKFDIVHVNVDFPRDDDGDIFPPEVARVGSDHEPLLARFDLRDDEDDDKDKDEDSDD